MEWKEIKIKLEREKYIYNLEKLFENNLVFALNGMERDKNQVREREREIYIYIQNLEKLLENNLVSTLNGMERDKDQVGEREIYI